MLNGESKTLIISSLLKKECRENLITQQMITEQVGKSKQYVSFVISGTLSASPEFVKTVLAMMNKNIQFNYNENYKNRMEELVDDYLSEYCYKMDDYYLKKAEEVLCEDMYYSFACPEFLALQCAVNYRLKKYDDVNYWIKVIEKHYKEMLKTSSGSILLYLLIKSEVQIDQNNFSAALETLKEAKEHASS
ncbi:MAG: hypothetical protein J6K75_07620, partial [Erysipelotrichaceae bacterium]|nr:hypothetical protein [Erysipelotrichaceae bacterium]